MKTSLVITILLLSSPTIAGPRAYIEKGVERPIVADELTALHAYATAVWVGVQNTEDLHCLERPDGVTVSCQHTELRTGSEDDLANALAGRKVHNAYICDAGVCTYPYTDGYRDLTATQTTSLRELADAVWGQRKGRLGALRVRRTVAGQIIKRHFAANATAAEYITRHAAGQVK